MDEKGVVPSMHMIKELIDECERIERNKAPVEKRSNEDNNNNNNKNNKKTKFSKTEKTQKKVNKTPVVRQMARPKGHSIALSVVRTAPATRIVVIF